MKNIIEYIDIYFTLIIIEIFSVISIMFFMNPSISFMQYTMLVTIIMIMTIAYYKGTVWGLLSSSITIFIYAAYLFFYNNNLREEISLTSFVWMGIIPLTAIITGRFSFHLKSMKDEYLELKKENNNLSTIDKITGLGNEKAFYDNLDREISRSVRHNHKLTLMIISIPYYRELRAVIGYGKIKEVIYELGNIINNLTRVEDIIYTLNYNKMAVIMPETDIDGALLVKERIKFKSKDIEIKNKSNKDVKIDLKIGCLTYSESIENSFKYKKLAEKEIEYDV